MDERLSALEHSSEYEQGTWRRLAATFGENGHDSGADDLLRTLIGTYSHSTAEGVSLAPTQSNHRHSGPSDATVYRHPEPFEINDYRG